MPDAARKAASLRWKPAGPAPSRDQQPASGSARRALAEDGGAAPPAPNVSRPARAKRKPPDYGDLVNKTLLREEIISASTPTAGAKDRLLVFWPVGMLSVTRDLVVKNIDHLHAFQAAGLQRPIHFDVFLVHYDGERDAWREAVGPSWYDAHVRYSLEYQGLKLWMARDILLSRLNGSSPALNSYGIDIGSYEYLWLLDEDADFGGVDLRLLVDLARESRAGIMTPAFETGAGLNVSMMRQSNMGGEVSETSEGDRSSESGESSEKEGGGEDSRCQHGERNCGFQAPKPSCRYRITDFVEVSFALFKPAIFRAVMLGCPGCMPSRESIWGLDHVWCSVANWEGLAKRRSCAILDATPIIHQNYKTLPKYSSEYFSERQYYRKNARNDITIRYNLGGLWHGQPTEISCN